MPSALVTVKLGAATSPVVGSMLVFNALATGFNWLTFTPSVSAVPLATLVTLLPPLFSPPLVSDTGEPAVPLAIVRPLLPNTLSPAVTCGVVSPSVVSTLLPTVTLLNATSSAVSIVSSLPLRFTRMFLPCFTVTVSPAAIFSLSLSASSFAFSFQPLSAVAFTDLIASWMVFSPVPPISSVDTLPFSFLASPPKMFFRFTWVASSWASVAALFESANGAAPNVVLLSPLTVPVVPSMLTGLPLSCPILTVSASFSCTPPSTVSLTMLLSPLMLIVPPNAYLLLPVVPPTLMPLVTSSPTLSKAS
ncbi:hypothetical protein MCC93_05760 [Morococcus cerebrosus]|uniref:Uncharacterized protein n=1 Tax=Morococcus cerebrosus TaxID=1056807 RepID=A0A0C1GXR9_9NEIS|nr:hypothetical protein MCC93_05760 [Morococcus cerebrosus]